MAEVLSEQSRGPVTDEVAKLLAVLLEPGGSGDESYIGMRRLLLHQKALAGQLRRQAWRCNGMGYGAFRQLIRQQSKLRHLPASSSPTESPGGFLPPRPAFEAIAEEHQDSDAELAASAEEAAQPPVDSTLNEQDQSDDAPSAVETQAMETAEAAAVPEEVPAVIDSDDRTSTSAMESLPCSSLPATNRVPAGVGNPIGDSRLSISALLHTFDDRKAAVGVVKFARVNLNLIAFASEEGFLWICSVSESSPIHTLHCLKGHNRAITDFDWSGDDEYICTASNDKSVRVWSAARGECVRFVYFSSPQTCIRFHPINNNWLLIADANRQVAEVNFSTGLVLHQLHLESNVTALDMSPDGTVLFAGDSLGCVHSITVDPATGTLKRAHRNTLGIAHPSPATAVQFRPFSVLATGPVLLAFNLDGSLRFFSVVLALGGSLLLMASLHLTPRAHTVRAAFCPVLSRHGGEYIVAGHDDHLIYFYDFMKPKSPLAHKLSGHMAPVLDLSWSADGAMLASSDCDGTVNIWHCS